MILEAKIAWRYLAAKKSYSAINAISIVSVCGVAVATMAIVCVLSVFNGFRQVLGSKLDLLTPIVRVEPAAGKVIANGDSLAEVIRKIPGVQTASCMVTDNALALYAQREMPVTLIGVDPKAYSQMTSISKIILDPGRYSLSYPLEQTSSQPVAELSEEELLFADAEDLYADAPELLVTDSIGHEAVISVGTASSLQIYVDKDPQPLHIFTPRRKGQVNMGNPATSFLTDSLPVSGVFRSEQSQFDTNTIIVDLDIARKLLQYQHEASAIDIQPTPSTDVGKFIKQLQKSLGDKYIAKDRLMQQEANFRMVNIEKWVTFLLLAFILLVASFNIISAISMLIIEKEQSLDILRKLGATQSMIGRIFVWESIYVNGIGAAAGIVVGLILCLIQQHYGIIGFGDESAKMIIDAYPVQVQFSDMPAILLLVAFITAMTSLIAMRFAKKRTTH